MLPALRIPLRVTWWRIPAGDVPSGRDARAEGLNTEWARVDDWIARLRGQQPLKERAVQAQPLPEVLRPPHRPVR